MDWHQTEEEVVISIYSKIPIPSLSAIEANPVKINISIVFGHDKKEYVNQLILGGIISLEKSKVSFMGSKVEIVLKKAEKVSWPRLAM